MKKLNVEQSLEQWLPYFGAAVSGLAWYLYFRNAPLPENTPQLVTALMNVYAVLIGFLATALALLFAIDDRSVIRFLRENYLYKRFIRFFFEAIIASGIALIYSSALVIHEYNMDSKLSKWLITSWFIFSVTAVLTCTRVFWMLFITLHKQVIEDEGNQ